MENRLLYSRSKANMFSESRMCYAIALDNSNTFNQVGSTWTNAFTCTGSNLVLTVGNSQNSNTDKQTGVAYAGQAMTKTDTITGGIANSRTDLWVLAAPATGSNNCVSSWSASANGDNSIQSYTGCAQTGQPDAHNTGTVLAATSITISVTTTADNCWLVGKFQDSLGGSAASTNTFLRTSFGGSSGTDSNTADTPAGSFGQRITNTAMNAQGCVMAIAPYVATINRRLLLLGVR